MGEGGRGSRDDEKEVSCIYCQLYLHLGHMAAHGRSGLQRHGCGRDALYG